MIQELRQFLQQRLPEYMLPAAFVFLEALPLTPNGKVDRRGLPLPDPTRPTLEEAFVEPRTPVERALAGIWAEVLGLKQVGAMDNFFELGGHSLKATQVMSRVRGAFDVELPLRRFFETPTVAGLAMAIEDRQMPRKEHEDLAALLEDIERLSDDEAQEKLRHEGIDHTQRS
jgi:acyl carrier protein